MRKYLLPAIVMGVGAFILTMGLLFRFYAYPSLAVVPDDTNTTQIVQDANAQFFDADNVKPAEGELTTTSRIIGDPEASEEASEEMDREVAVWNSGQVSDNNGDNMPMDGSTAVYVFDAHTGEAINCCGASRNGEEVEREGLLVKFPFDAQKTDDYKWWDGTVGKAYSVDYEGAEEIQGMEVYKYTMEVPEQKFTSRELPGSLFGGEESAPAVEADRYYENQRTFWVDPVTGVVIDRVEEQHQEFRHDGQSITAIDTTSRFTKGTVDENVETYQTQSALLAAVHTTLPIIFTVVGVLLLLGGLVLSLAIGRRTRREGRSDYVDSGEDPVFGSMSSPDETTAQRRDIPGTN